MGFVFATCNPERALYFINKMYPEQRDLVKEDISLLYDLIKKDVLRVQDPNFHQPCSIIAGENYKEDYDNKISEAIDEFVKKIKEEE